MEGWIRYLKERTPRWRQRGVISLAGSGITGGENLLLEHMTAHPDRLRELLGTANEWGHEAVIDRLRRRYGYPATHVVLPVSGASTALGLVYQALRSGLRRGRLAVETPVYDPLFRIPRYLGVRGVDWLPRDPRRKYALDPDTVERAMTPQTQLLVLTNPHNPSGFALPPETLRQIARAARHVNPGVLILVDETYLDFHFPACPPATLLDPCFLSIGGVSKVYGLGALRFGWIVAPPEVGERLRTAWLQLQNTNSALTESLAILVLYHLDEYRALWQRLAANDDLVRTMLTEAGEWLAGEVAPGSCFCFPEVRLPDVPRLLDRLERRWRVALGPGRFFRAPQNVRIGFGMDSATLRSGLERLAEGIRREADDQKRT